MRRMDNIYHSVDSYLVNNGYREASTDEKKEMTIEGLKRYLAAKVIEINPSTRFTEEQLDNVDINDLIDLITTILPENEHEKNLSNVIRYLLGNASQLQGSKIVWEREISEDLENGVSIEFNSKGNLKVVKTHVYPSYNYAMRFLIEIYRSNLFIKQKQLFKSRKEQ